MQLIFDDGGRAKAGFTGIAGDCCCRAFAIAAQRDYREVYEAIRTLATKERTGKRKRGVSSPRDGVYKNTAHKLAYILNPRVRWVPTMGIGMGCRVHLRDGELPMGRLVVQVSKHFVAVVDGIMHDIHDPSRAGTRCVYGYWDFSNLH